MSVWDVSERLWILLMEKQLLKLCVIFRLLNDDCVGNTVMTACFYDTRSPVTHEQFVLF